MNVDRFQPFTHVHLYFLKEFKYMAYKDNFLLNVDLFTLHHFPLLRISQAMLNLLMKSLFFSSFFSFVADNILR